jgi:hypothetical protein
MQVLLSGGALGFRSGCCTEGLLFLKGESLGTFMEHFSYDNNNKKHLKIYFSDAFPQ